MAKGIEISPGVELDQVFSLKEASLAHETIQLVNTIGPIILLY